MQLIRYKYKLKLRSREKSRSHGNLLEHIGLFIILGYFKESFYGGGTSSVITKLPLKKRECLYLDRYIIKFLQKNPNGRGYD